MKKSSCSDNFDLARLVILALALFSCFWSLAQGERHRRPRTPMHKIQFTQKGYIQFLRWELPVPDLTEFTFCLWLESTDLTHLHPIFSYSKNERDRLVRAWISPRGRSVHLEIGGREVLAASTDIRENRWYHVCLSWENGDGRYGLWINDQLWTHGRSQETTGYTIPKGGDIVVAQEYTDFDKGLEDGIEGSILGFNLLLASAFEPLALDHVQEASPGVIPQPSASSYATAPLFARIPSKVAQRGVGYGTRTSYTFVPIYYRRLRRHVDEKPAAGSKWESSRIDSRLDAKFGPSKPDKEPLGLKLVKLSYVRCEIGRGSPFIGGPLMLISWSRTPVRVFGGATVKNVKGECGNFSELPVGLTRLRREMTKSMETAPDSAAAP